MGTTTVVTCDHCLRDITSTGNSIDWRIDVVNTKLHARGTGIVTDMWITPSLDHNLAFCGAGCLRAWALSHIPAPQDER